MGGPGISQTAGTTIDKSPFDNDNKPASGLRNVSLAAKQSRIVGVDSSKNYPMTTKEVNGQRNGHHTSLMQNLNNMMASGSNRKTESQPAKQAASTRSTKLSGQKLRKLPDGARAVEVEDLPSDISLDEWGEIQKFGQRLHEEQIKKQKAQHENRVKQVREVLD